MRTHRTLAPAEFGSKISYSKIAIQIASPFQPFRSRSFRTSKNENLYNFESFCWHIKWT